MPAKRGLILGGTREARELADLLAGNEHFDLITSLAGDTTAPRKPQGKVRTGGFGGWQGLATYLGDEKIDVLVDATHPFAAQISGNAVKACAEAGVAHLLLVRQPWMASDGDNWTLVTDAGAAAKTVSSGTRAFLTIGRKEVSAFLDRSDVTFISRSIEPLDCVLPPNWTHIEARPPFSLEEELAVFKRYDIDVLVSKNSGGADNAKLEAARRLSVPLIMIERSTAQRAPDASTAPEMAELMRALFTTD